MAAFRRPARLSTIQNLTVARKAGFALFAVCIATLAWAAVETRQIREGADPVAGQVAEVAGSGTVEVE